MKAKMQMRAIDEAVGKRKNLWKMEDGSNWGPAASRGGAGEVQTNAE